MINWEVDLAPRGHLELELHYTVSKKKDVTGI